VVSSYGGVGVAVLANIMLVPVYLRFIELSTYGAWLASGGILQMLGLADAGIGQVCSQRMAYRFGKRDLPGFAAAAGAGWLWIVCAAVIVATSGSLVAAPVIDWLQRDTAVRSALITAFRLGAVGAALTVVQVAIFFACAAWQRPGVPGIVRIVANLTGVAVTVLCLVRGDGVVAFGWGALARGGSGVLIAAWHVAVLWRRMKIPRPRLEWSEARSQVKVAMPVFAGRVGVVVAGNADAAIIANVLGTELAAIYVLNARAIQAAQLLLDPLGMACYSGLAHLAGDAPKRLAHVSRDVLVLSGVGSAAALGTAAALNQAFVGVWLGPDRFGGSILTIGLAVSALIVTRVNILGAVLVGVGYLAKPSVVTALAAGVRLLLLFVFAYTVGLAGIPLATAVSSLLLGLYAAYAVVRQLALARREGLELVSVALPTALAGVGLGTVYAYLSPPVTTWAGFAASAAVAGLLAAVGTVSSRTVRETWMQMWKLLRERR
jgi:O-antigen/teichoic acid export membrane protein